MATKKAQLAAKKNGDKNNRGERAMESGRLRTRGDSPARGPEGRGERSGLRPKALFVSS